VKGGAGELVERARERGRPPAGERGQASLELLASLPLLVAVALAGAQLLAVGYSSVLAGNAAEAGALALAGGGDRSAVAAGGGSITAGVAEAAARAALPGWSRAHASVAVTGGQVNVTVHPPTLLRALTGELEVGAEAAVEAP
jgi:hypothetical protein